MSLAKVRLVAIALAGLSVVAYACDALLLPADGDAGRVAVGLAVVSTGLFIGDRINAAAERTALSIEAAVEKTRQNMDATLGVAAEFGRASERRRGGAGTGLAPVREIHPQGRGGKR